MVDKNNFKVYVHTNKTNGKRYIGITGRTVEERWENGHGYKRGPFKEAIKKYGWNGFDHDILHENLTEEKAKELEIKYIKELNSYSRKGGYNLSIGGEGASGYKHTEEAKKKISFASKNISEETKKKLKDARTGTTRTNEQKKHMSEARMGIVFTEEHRRHISEATTGDKNPKYWKGKKRDQETCEKIRQKLGKKVICVETGEIYNSAKEASIILGVAKSCVTKWCLHGVKPRYINLTFKFYEEV